MKKIDWRRILGLILIAAGLYMLFLYFRPAVQVWQNEHQVAIDNISRDQIEENKDKEIPDEDYNTANVRTVSQEDVNTARKSIKEGKENLNVIGAVAMPEQKAQVSVMKGLSEPVLLSGAGTFYPDQVMGEGNYALASHNIPHQLLTDMIYNTESGDPIYLTDLTTVWKYETYYADAVSPDRVDLVDPELRDDQGRPIITLQTCTDDGTLRYIVQGALVDEMPFDQAPQEVIDLFKSK